MAPLEVRAGVAKGYFNQLTVVVHNTKYACHLGCQDGFQVGSVVGYASLGNPGALVFRHPELTRSTGHAGYRLCCSSGDALLITEAARMTWTREEEATIHSIATRVSFTMRHVPPETIAMIEAEH